MKPNPKYNQLSMAGVLLIFLGLLLVVLSIVFRAESEHSLGNTSIYLFEWKIGYSSWENIYMTLSVCSMLIGVLFIILGYVCFAKRKNVDKYVEIIKLNTFRPIVCPYCSKENPLGTNHCIHCGESLINLDNV